jgi:hypothetical protein
MGADDDTATEQSPLRWSVRLRSAEAAALAGIVFGVLFAAVFIVLAESPAADASVEEISAWLEDPGSAERMVFVQSLALAAVVAFLWFIGVFRRRVLGRSDEFTGSVFLGSGLVIAALAAVGISLLTAPTIAFEGAVTPTAVSAYATSTAVGETSLGVFANGLAGVFALSSATLIRQSGAFPRSLTVVGYVLAFLLIISPLGLVSNTVLFPAWIALISIDVLFRRDELPNRSG